ncbi:hypothetical protein Hdeb2414_s0657g00930981 [Helianthus debilis subsp. tardiflorus]
MEKGVKRKFTWFLNEWAGNRDGLNAREADGTLKPLKEYTGPLEDNGHQIAPDIAPPEGFMTNEMIDFWDEIYEVSRKPFYDSEELALGSLNKSEYMLVPSNWAVDECPIESIGSGMHVYKVPTPTMAAVYALAKEQAKDLKFSDDDQIKWALLRLEAFKSGWFARQKYTMFKPAPNGSVKIMLDDAERISDLIKHAHALCFFLPFMTEYHFRAFGASYNQTTSADYLTKAQDLAAAASLSECLTYMDHDVLHGKVLGWIGVKRPMQVLRNTAAITRVPNPFQIRAFSAPAGQAVISTSIEVINSIKAAGWWENIKQVGGYDDSTLISVGAEIASNPWKFHLMNHVYGEESPDEDEARQVAEAKKSAIMFAPILQAYASTVVKDTSLGRIKALKKHADANNYLFTRARRLFAKVTKTRGDNISQVISQVFSADAFRIADGSKGAK